MFPQQFNKSVKLRLRGRGSGYKEGPEKQGIFPIFLKLFRSFIFIRYFTNAFTLICIKTSSVLTEHIFYSVFLLIAAISIFQN
jgi:hypothetical protein